jgi:hypothetical protein
MLEALMERDVGGEKSYKVFSSLAAAAELIDPIATAHGFKVCASSEYVKCTRWGHPKGKEKEPGKQERNRKSQKCGCEFAIHVCTNLCLQTAQICMKHLVLGLRTCPRAHMHDQARARGTYSTSHTCAHLQFKKCQVGDKVMWTLGLADRWNHTNGCEPSASQVRRASSARGDDTRLTQQQWEHLATLVIDDSSVAAIKYVQKLDFPMGCSVS